MLYLINFDRISSGSCNFDLLPLTPRNNTRVPVILRLTHREMLRSPKFLSPVPSRHPMIALTLHSICVPSLPLSRALCPIRCNAPWLLLPEIRRKPTIHWCGTHVVLRLNFIHVLFRHRTWRENDGIESTSCAIDINIYKKAEGIARSYTASSFCERTSLLREHFVNEAREKKMITILHSCTCQS